METDFSLLTRQLYQLTRKNTERNFDEICSLLERNLSGDRQKFKKLNLHFYSCFVRCSTQADFNLASEPAVAAHW